jgi:hypothetical protein
LGCAKALGVSKLTSVHGKLKAWIGDMNRKAGANKPFKGHRNASPAELVHIVANWCIITGFVKVISPPEQDNDGMLRLFPANLAKMAHKGS